LAAELDERRPAVTNKDWHILLGIGQLRQHCEEALDRGDTETAVRFYAAAEAKLFAFAWERGMVKPVAPAEELTELQQLQRDLADVVRRANEGDEPTRAALWNLVIAIAERERRR
jgi:hypothetical protein